MTAAKNLNPTRTKDVHSSNSRRGEQSPKTFLIGSCGDVQGIVKCCPYASTLCCIEASTGLEALIAISCKRWGCKYCGPRKSFQLALRCEAAAPTKFITLTVKNALYQSPQDAYDQTRRKVPAFAKALRLYAGEFEYLKVLEATAAGWPHYHFVCRCRFIPQAWLSDTWRALSGASIVDVRAIKKQEGVFKYVMKYLCKQKYIPWTDRRVSWSKNFFPKIAKIERTEKPFINGEVKPRHPADVMLDHFANRQVIQRGPNVWVIADSSGPTNRLPRPINPERKIKCRRNRNRSS